MFVFSHFIHSFSFIHSHIQLLCHILKPITKDYCSPLRKIEIVQFASRTRQLFVRLLALVKWASNAGKVEKCAVCCACGLVTLLLTFILVIRALKLC